MAATSKRSSMVRDAFRHAAGRASALQQRRLADCEHRSRRPLLRRAEARHRAAAVIAAAAKDGVVSVAGGASAAGLADESAELALGV